MLKGLASDGGLYIPEEIPKADGWQRWKDLSFADLAFEVMSLYISPAEIPPADLKEIIAKSYATFRCPETTPLVHLKDNLWLLELFHGPTFAFKDVALQFLGNLFEYFLVRRNEGKSGKGMLLCTVRASAPSALATGLAGRGWVPDGVGLRRHTRAHRFRLTIANRQAPLDRRRGHQRRYGLCSHLRTQGQEGCLRLHPASQGTGEPDPGGADDDSAG